MGDFERLHDMVGWRENTFWYLEIDFAIQNIVPIGVDLIFPSVRDILTIQRH